MFIRKKELKEIHDELKKYKKKVEKLESEVGVEDEESSHLSAFESFYYFHEPLTKKVERLQTKMDALEEYFDITTEKVSAHTKYKKNKKAKK